MKVTFKLVLLMFFICCGTIVQAQDTKFKSAYLYQFGRIMDWPDLGSEFTIAVWGESDVTPVIEKIAQIKKIDDKKITVKKVSDISQLKGCQIVFIPENSFSVINSVKSSTSNKGVLIVSEKKGSTKSGAGISFIKVNDKMLFEINKNNIEAGGLKSTLSLERIAHKVY